MKKLLLFPLALGLLLPAAPSLAQSALQEPTKPAYKADRIVTGTVTDFDSRAPLHNVSVRVRGTETGTSTDENGQYALRVPNAARADIYFQIGGYVPVERRPGDRRVLNVRLWRGKNLKLDSMMNVTSQPVPDRPAWAVLRKGR